MRLQTRLAVATAAVLVPLVLGLTWLDARARHSAATTQLIELIHFRNQLTGARGRCEADPIAYGGPVRSPPPSDGDRAPPFHRPPFPPLVLHLYDHLRQPTDLTAPAIPVALYDALGDDGVATVDSLWPGSPVRVLVRTPWTTGPCAFVLGDGTAGPGWTAAILPASRWWLWPAVAVVVVVLLAVAPLVRRLRRLTLAVQRSADDGFSSSIPVEGTDEVADLARAFAAVSEEVRTQLAVKDQRDRALRDFLANTTHDVMIPLTVLQAHLANLRDHNREGQPIDRDALTSAMDEAHYIASLLHNLGVAAKLDAGAPALHRTRVPLDRLIERICARHRPIARQLEVTLDVALPDPPLACDGDVTLLEQAVSNVVYNAIRHNRKGGHVAILLEPQPGDHFRLRVLDDGPGVPGSDLDRVGERGFRGDAARGRATGGQGLGLHIAHRVAAVHDMTLTLGPSDFGGLQVDLVGPVALELK